MEWSKKKRAMVEPVRQAIHLIDFLSFSCSLYNPNSYSWNFCSISCYWFDCSCCCCCFFYLALWPAASLHSPHKSHFLWGLFGFLYGFFLVSILTECKNYYTMDLVIISNCEKGCCALREIEFEMSWTSVLCRSQPVNNQCWWDKPLWLLLLQNVLPQ